MSVYKKNKELCFFADIMIRRFQMVKKILMIILPLSAIGLCLYFSLSAYLTYREDYVEVYVASHNLVQRTRLSEQDLEKRKLPRQYLSQDICLEKQDILDKYVKLSCMIPKGAFFYKGFLQSDIKDLAHTLLRQGEVNYDIYVNEVKVNAGSLDVGMYVDLYLSVGGSHEKPESGLLIENCRITGLFDGQGRMIQSYDSDSKAVIISLALMKEDVSYLNKAQMVGSISVIVNAATYNLNSSSRLITDSEVFKYLQ